VFRALAGDITGDTKVGFNRQPVVTALRNGISNITVSTNDVQTLSLHQLRKTHWPGPCHAAQTVKAPMDSTAPRPDSRADVVTLQPTDVATYIIWQ